MKTKDVRTEGPVPWTRYDNLCCTTVLAAMLLGPLCVALVF